MTTRAPGVEKRDLLVSRTWIQAIMVVFLFGFFVMGLLAYRTYMGSPPIPGRVIDPAGRVLFTHEDIVGGQEIFLRYGLMEYGSIFGHGAYLGPDYTTDYLHRSALIVRERYGGEGSDHARAQTIKDFKTNHFDAVSGVLTFSSAQGFAFEQLAKEYGLFFSEPTTRHGLFPHAIADPRQIRKLTAFFAWSAWAASTQRPGINYSYTNNWPPEPLVDNHPTANIIVWSVLSLAALLGGMGILFAAFGRWNMLGWHGREQQALTFHPPGKVALTPSQRATAGFFLVMALLFLVQALVGSLSQHYRADVENFFGFDMARLLPYNVARTWHLQLSILWVATSFLGAGIFLAPMIAKREPKGQHLLTYGLLAALAVVVVGSLSGEWLGIHNIIRSNWQWFGN